jgi:superfamily II DNA or RNA helicase
MDFENLRDYQKESIEKLREGIRNGHRSQVLVAPTGSGKTVMAAYLLGEAYSKGSPAFFVCDRVSLVDQTSATLDAYKIPHGVIQANHWRARPWERIQVVSAQTLARRNLQMRPKLLLWDESHTMYASVRNYCDNQEIKVIGLTATPFTKGMGEVFTNVVNSTTTNTLIDQGWLVPLKVYAAKEVDMTGAKLKFDGEWQDSEIEKRGIQIVGDVVEEWIQKTGQYFNGPAKTIAFSATVAHGDEMCKRFQERGFNFQQISYKDGNDDRRRRLIEEFRRPDSEIVGLVSCEALAKGFDVTDIQVGIGARPYRKSLSGHIQQLGRVMRSHPGKEFALWLDHSGNCLRFMEDMQTLFANGVDTLPEESWDAKTRKEKTEKEKLEFKCFSCGFVHMQEICPACGAARQKKKQRIEERAGQMQELDFRKAKRKNPDWMQDKEKIWRMLGHIAYEKKQGNTFMAEKFALAQYRNIYGTWPNSKFDPSKIIPASMELKKKVRQQLILWAKRK